MSTIFSIMKNLGTDERNRMDTSLVKAEICTRINFEMSCNEFYDFVSKRNDILSAAKSNKKCKFKVQVHFNVIPEINLILISSHLYHCILCIFVYLNALKIVHYNYKLVS